jgi:hypothetical protein
MPNTSIARAHNPIQFRRDRVQRLRDTVTSQRPGRDPEHFSTTHSRAQCDTWTIDLGLISRRLRIRHGK